MTYPLHPNCLPFDLSAFQWDAERVVSRLPVMGEMPCQHALLRLGESTFALLPLGYTVPSFLLAPVIRVVIAIRIPK